MLFLLTDSPKKLNLEKINGTLIIFFLCKFEFSSTTKNMLFYQKDKKPHTLASDWREYTNSCFKENAGTFSKNSTTQENIRISRLKTDYKTSTKKKISNHKLNQ